jgi:hypothetical protein
MNAICNKSAIIYRSFSTTSRVFCSKPEIPRNILEDLTTSQHQNKPGAVYDKKPFKFTLEAGMRDDS